MARKAKIKPKLGKTSKNLKTQIQKTKQIFFRRLQQIMKKSCSENGDSNNSDYMLFPKKYALRKFKKGDSSFSRTNICDERSVNDNYMCYRCQHFLKLPTSLLQPIDASIFEKQCKTELKFVQAIVWLKSAIACVSQISVEQLQQIFDGQQNTHDIHYCKDIEQQRSIDKSNLISERLNIRNAFSTLTPLNISNVSYLTPQRITSYIRFENTSKSLSCTLANSANQLSTESSVVENSNSCHIIARKNKKEIVSSIIPETDEESVLSENLSDDTPEHQRFEYEKNTECSLKSGIEQINEKILQSSHILQKNNAFGKYQIILSKKNQSVDSMFSFEKDLNKECFTLIKNQDNLAERMLEFDGNSKSLSITQKDISQISNISNEYLGFSFNDNNSPCQVNNVVENQQEDSAYSTSRYDIFNYDSPIETGPTINKKRLLDNNNDNKLQSYKKMTTINRTEKVSLINDTLISNNSPESLIITQKDISQISDIYNTCIFRTSSNCNENMSDIMFKNKIDNPAVTAKAVDDKYVSIKHHEMHSNEKIIIPNENVMYSTSTTQKDIDISATNIEYCNLQDNKNNSSIDSVKEISSITKRLQKNNSKQTQNLSEKVNKNEKKMVSANCLNITLQSLRIESVLIKSIEVILSTLCNKTVVEEYIMKEQCKNTRNFWKDSLEEEAVSVILNICDIFTTEKKPNICIKIIMTAIVQTLTEMTICVQPNEICTNDKTSVWIYRIQIILQFCNSLPICIKVTDYLMTRLKLFQSTLNNIKDQENIYIVINQLHLIFYALNITLRKYRIIIPNNQLSRSEKIIPHVTDLWKIRYIKKELEYTNLDLDAVEKRWLNTLENSAAIFTKNFVQFAEKSLSLVHVLMQSSNIKITKF